MPARHSWVRRCIYHEDIFYDSWTRCFHVDLHLFFARISIDPSSTYVDLWMKTHTALLPHTRPYILLRRGGKGKEGECIPIKLSILHPAERGEPQASSHRAQLKQRKIELTRNGSSFSKMLWISTGERQGWKTHPMHHYQKFILNIPVTLSEKSIHLATWGEKEFYETNEEICMLWKMMWCVIVAMDTFNINEESWMYVCHC